MPASPSALPERSLRVRWLGRVRYDDATALQHGLLRSSGSYLLLLEHPHVYTLGLSARPEHVLVEEPASVGAELRRADRGGDVTYHGPGQLVGYAILDVATGPGAVPSHVARLEQLVIDVLGDLGLPGAGRLDGYPGVWLDPDGPRARKVCAVGTRISRGRSMHGFALNVEPDLEMFGHIVPCGIEDRPVTSLAAEGLACSVADVVEAVVARAPSLVASLDGAPPVEVQRATGPASGAAQSGSRALERRLAAAGEDLDAAIPLTSRKPEWLRAEMRMGDEFLQARRRLRDLRLVTVCEEAGCPNIFECWSDGTATFMINGERCTRACGFCLVDTSRPLPLDETEPERVAGAVEDMDLAHAVVTAVARDDLEDGGAAAFAATIRAIRDRRPGTTVEVLIPDCKGDPVALRTIFDARPDVLNHNLETVLRLQRAVRPSASYARSLAVLARARAAGLTTKSGLVLGMGEHDDEVLAALRDLRAVGVQIVTIGQYLRPSLAQLPVARWWRPEELADLGDTARAMGFSHVEASPLARSSYHAREAVAGTPPGALAPTSA